MTRCQGFQGHNGFVDYADSQRSSTTRGYPPTRAHGSSTVLARTGQETTELPRLPPIQQLFDQSNKGIAETPSRGHTLPNPTGWSNQKPLPACQNSQDSSDDMQSASVTTTSTRSETASVTRRTLVATGPFHRNAVKMDIQRNELQPGAEDQVKRQAEADKDCQKEKHAGKERCRRADHKEFIDQIKVLLTNELGYKLEPGTKNQVEKSKILKGSVDALQEFGALLTALWALVPELALLQEQCQTSETANPTSSSPVERVLAIVYRHPSSRARSFQPDLKPSPGNLPSPISLHAAGSPFAHQKRH